MPEDLTSASGIAALAAGGVALIALLLALVLLFKLRRVRSAQTVVLGTSGERDLVTHAENVEIGFAELKAFVEQTFQQLQERLAADEHRLERTISRSAVVRYDAWGEMSGRQSSSMALLDDTGTGVVLSSILHRDQARLYVKSVRDRESDVELSPEEEEALRTALGEVAVTAAPRSGQAA